MTPLLIAGSARPSLAADIAAELQTEVTPCLVDRFPDGELQIEIQASVRGRSVFVVQPLGPPVGESLLELLLLADGCHRAGAASVAAVVPYVAYARQDRVTKEGQPLGARVLAEVLGTGELQQIIAVDLHSPVVASCCDAPIVHLTAVPAMLDALRPHVREDTVVVAPDLGAVKLAEAYARPLDLPLVVVHKLRASGSDVAVRSIVGNVRGKRPLVVDDMISTGGTVAAAVDALRAQGCLGDFTVAATHGLFVGGAAQRLDRSDVARIFATDSLAPPARAPRHLGLVRLAPLLAEAIRRITSERGLNELLAAR